MIERFPMDVNESEVQDEVEALKAIYGDEHISYTAKHSRTSPGSISISFHHLLDVQPHVAGPTIKLSALLPDAYPRQARPTAPTLRADGVSTLTCSVLVERMLQRQSGGDGEVCLFQYCDAMIEVLNEFGGEVEKTEIKAGASGEGEEAEREKKFVLYHGEPLTDRKSVFQAHIAEVKSMEDVDGVLRQLKQSSRKIATATHNTFAYRVLGKEGSILQDVDDDGEKGAGKCMMYVLQQMEVVDVLCVVSRWFGGIKLGPMRFKHIGKVTRDVAEENLSRFPTAAAAKR